MTLKLKFCKSHNLLILTRKKISRETENVREEHYVESWYVNILIENLLFLLFLWLLILQHFLDCVIMTLNWTPFTIEPKSKEMTILWQRSYETLTQKQDFYRRNPFFHLWWRKKSWVFKLCQCFPFMLCQGDGIFWNTWEN